MRITVAAVGNRMPEWVKSACDEYLRRMPRDLAVQLAEVRPGVRSEGRPIERVLEDERDRLMERIPADSAVVALDERGSLWTTRDLAARLDGARIDARHLTFLIGGADGLHASFKAGGQTLFSLSRLTLPHGLARVVLCEQLYRAASLLHHHPYHRD